VFLLLFSLGAGITPSVLAAFFLAAGVNYGLCVWLLFERRVKWSASTETVLYLLLICAVAAFDVEVTRAMIYAGVAPIWAKATAAALGLVFNFLGRRFIVFPQRRFGSWKPAVQSPPPARLADNSGRHR